MSTKKNQHEPTIVGFVGVGLDDMDGHQRLTRSEHFLLVGGSLETHERMQDVSIRFTEKLHNKGKRLEETSIPEALDLLLEAADD